MTAGYSATPQARKLGLKPGQRVAVIDAPAGWALTDPPPGLVDAGGAGPADLILGFFRSDEELQRRLPALAERIFPAGVLWLAWPRRAGGHRSDLTDSGVRARILGIGLVDTKVAAIDEDWSGQKVVWRVSNRATPPQR